MTQERTQNSATVATTSEFRKTLALVLTSRTIVPVFSPAHVSHSRHTLGSATVPQKNPSHRYYVSLHNTWGLSDCSPAGHEIPRPAALNPKKIQYSLQRRPPLAPILRQISSVYAVPYFFKIHFNVLPSTHISSKGQITFMRGTSE
jgi:hypothetical protein